MTFAINSLIGLGFVPAEGQGPPITGDWGEDTIDVGGWMIDPGAGGFVWAPPGSAITDPFQYKYELQCHLGGGDFDTECLAVLVDCKNGPDGKDGIPVVWLKAPAGVPNPVWSFHSGPTCLFDPKPEDLLPRIAALIQSEFQKLPVAPGQATAQPSPHTLRGADTNFYAQAVEQQFDVKILNQDVHVTAKPVQYTWNYGDGTALGPTTAAGGPLPQDRWGEKTATSHAYAETGDFSVVLTTHFQGTYSVNGGPPLPIPGQGQFSGPPRTVSVWRSITRNYADDCLKNPQGQGCPGVPTPPR
ncbi:hypothetical protein [Arthrobacter sp. B3I4]|uniref:hypothetical protein n=1 Tax=Arthrobacter sp. B3I4 TaxID=3042267 RepID=UPI002785A8BC|nr:hypothetical protein [Arthrobacter sp. B3I4]MDQ0754036.1 hypothetical protein [Arthrobacter sp. B3I4]